MNRATLRLRTKFLLALVFTTAGLSCATLLLVRGASRDHVQEEIATSAQDSLLTFKVLLHEREITLDRKADLLATLAAMNEDDPSSLQDSADDPLENEGNLVVLANGAGKITALHSMNPGLTSAVVAQCLARSLASRKSSDWWYASGTLYQVVLQPVRDVLGSNAKAGTVVVGRPVDYAAVHDFGRISSSEVAFSYDANVVSSTFAPLDEQELSQKMRGLPSPAQLQVGRERYFVKSLDLGDGANAGTRLTVLKSYREATAFLTGLNHLLIGLGLIALLAGTGLAAFISDTFTRPLERLVEGVRALEGGDFKYPLKAQGGDEVAHVTRAFDRMRTTLQKNQAQKEQLEEQLRQAQKMEALGRLAGGVAHDFNNLLTVIKGHSDLMLERMNAADPLAGSGRQIQKAADRAAGLTRQLLAFSRRQPLQPTVLNLNALVADMSKLLRRLIHEDVEFLFRADESLGQIKADASQVEQLLLNLVVNACDAMPQGGKLLVQTRNVTVDVEYARAHPMAEFGAYVLLAVADTGQGMDAETKARMFEPFFTTKAQGKGTGLGLATVYGVVKQSGGFIQVDTEPGKGTTFEIYLPRVREQVQPAAATVSAPRARTGETVLLVEDEGDIRSLACEFLSSVGYRVITAEDGANALDIAERLGEPIHLLITDVVMPKMRGPELVKRLKSLLPDLRVIYISGYLEHSGANGDLLDEGPFLQKPFSREALVLQAGEVLKTARQPAPQTIAI